MIRRIILNMRYLKKSTCFIGIILSAILLLSCQKTPEESTVKKKAESNIEEIIYNAPVVLETTVPSISKESAQNYMSRRNWLYEDWEENIIWENQGSNIEVNVVIDAVIKYPKDIYFPVIRVKEIPFNVQDAKNVRDFFMGNSAIYEDSNEKTKYDYLDDLFRFKSTIENIKSRTDLTEDEKDREIEAYEDLIDFIEIKTNSAPTTLPLNEAQLEFQKANSSSGDAEIIKVCTNDDSSKQRLTVVNSPFDKIYYLEWYTSGMPYFAQEAEIDIELNIEQLSGYISDAINSLHELGINNMQLAGVSAISNGIEISDHHEMLNDDDMQNSCFVLHFTPDISGMPTTYANEMVGIDDDSELNYAPVYEKEYIEIYVDTSGIIRFIWQSPSEVIEVENSNVQTISLDEIKNIFLNQITISEAWTYSDSKKNIYIDRIEYGMTRVAIKDMNSEYRYVPSWTFFGYEELIMHTSSGEKKIKVKLPFASYLTINAIDGSIIDRSLGY